MNSFPFESTNTGTELEPVWDRAITAEMERSFNKLCYTNGVFAAPANGLMVSAMGGNLKTKINPGGCHINGARAYEVSQREITHSAASATLSRIDRIVCRFDTAEDKRNIEIYLKEGVLATTPSAPEIIRESNYYEIVLADVLIPKGATEITNSNITDRRLDTSVCGLVVPAIPYENQTSELWKQISDSINLVNAALSETEAAYLQAQITGIANGLGDVSSEDILPISKGGTGDTNRYINNRTNTSTNWNPTYFGDKTNVSSYRYYPYIKMVYLRVVTTTVSALAAGTEYTIASLFKSITDCQVTLISPLSNRCLKSVDAFAEYDSDAGYTKIKIRPNESVPVNCAIYISGWYAV